GLPWRAWGAGPRPSLGLLDTFEVDQGAVVVDYGTQFLVARRRQLPLPDLQLERCRQSGREPSLLGLELLLGGGQRGARHEDALIAVLYLSGGVTHLADDRDLEILQTQRVLPTRHLLLRVVGVGGGPAEGIRHADAKRPVR